MFWPTWSGAWIAVSWYQLSPGVGWKVTRRPLPFTVTRICLGSNPVYAYRKMTRFVPARACTPNVADPVREV